MQKKSIVPQDVTSFLGFLVALHGKYRLNDQNVVIEQHNTEKENPLYINHAGEPYPVRVYMDPVPQGSFWMINPFSGITRTPPELTWFYNNIRVPLATKLLYCLQVAVVLLLKSKDIKVPAAKVNFESIVEDTYLNELLAGNMGKKSISEEVDLKTYDEITSMIKTVVGDSKLMAQFLQIAYTGEDVSGRAYVGPLHDGEAWYEKSGIRIRKKTYPVFERLLLNFFGVNTVKEFDTFTAVSEVGESPKFGAWIRCYSKVLSTLNPVVAKLLPTLEVDSDALESWLEILPKLSSRAKQISGGFRSSPETDMVDISKPARVTPASTAKPAATTTPAAAQSTRPGTSMARATRPTGYGRRSSEYTTDAPSRISAVPTVSRPSRISSASTGYGAARSTGYGTSTGYGQSSGGYGTGLSTGYGTGGSNTGYGAPERRNPSASDWYNGGNRRF